MEITKYLSLAFALISVCSCSLFAEKDGDDPPVFCESDSFVFGYWSSLEDTMYARPQEYGLISVGCENHKKYKFGAYSNEEDGDDYDVEITADPGLGWVMLSEGETITIPIDCSWDKSQETPAGYQVYAGEENDVYIHVPAKGPVNGDPVAEFRLDWGDKAALRPGIYKTEISLVLSAV